MNYATRPSRYVSLERLAVAVGLAGSLLAALGAYATHATQGDLPTPRENAAVVELDGRVYVIGGFDRTETATTLVESYDLAADRWQQGSAMPTARGLPGYSAAAGHVYLIGGTLNGPDKLSTVEAYDPVRDQWGRVADLPTARNALSAATVAGKIYALGGWGVDSDGRAKDFSTVEVYNPATDRWSPAAPMPTARSHMATVVVNDRIYTIGGWMWRAGRMTALAQVEVYDPADDSWERAADLPTPRWLATATVIDGRIYVLAGNEVTPDGSLAATSTVEVFDPGSGEWERDVDLRGPRAGHAAIAIDGQILLFGGNTFTLRDLGGVRVSDAGREKYLIAELERYRPSEPAALIPIAVSPTGDPAIARPVSVAGFRDGGAYGTIVEIQEPFGNLTTSFVESDLQRLQLAIGDRFQVQLGDRRFEVTLGKDFSDVATGDWVALLMPAGMLTLGMNFANAAATCACQPGTTAFIVNVVRDP